MSRLLALSGEFVATKCGYFHITAYDPASGLYIGLGHGLPSKEKLVGDTPQSCLGCKMPGYDKGFVPLSVDRHPLLGPVVLQNRFGICGVMRGRLRSGVCETGQAQLGQAWIVTDVLDLLTLAESLPIGLDGAVVWYKGQNCERLPMIDTALLADIIEDNALICGMKAKRTAAIPIQVTALRHKSGLGFAFSADNTMAGSSGSPIIQDGRIIGAVYGDGVARNIDQMVANLLWSEALDMGRGTNGSNKGNNRGGHGTGWNGGGGQGSGKRVTRSTQAGTWKRRVYNQQHGNLAGKVRAAHTMYQSLDREGPKIAALEVQVHRYETGNISQGILYQGHKVTYVDALKRIWAYHQAMRNLAAKSYVHAGVITEGQYREIVGWSPGEV